MEANRNHLRRFLPRALSAGDNLGLRLDKLNREIDEGSKHDHKDRMLTVMEGFKIGTKACLSDSYGHAFKRWKKIMTGRADCECFEIKAQSKVLPGTGNASVYEFGVNLNRPWGVPYISGSTLKGVASSYLAKYYGEGWWKKSSGDKNELQVEIFGGPLKKDNKRKDYIGLLDFMDAWLVPEKKQDATWFVPDIINPHYQGYYGEKCRRGQDHIAPPDGTENPIPVKIAALKSGLKFFVTIRGGKEEREFLKKILGEALLNEGVGGKTAVGYGRFEIIKSAGEENQALIEEIESADMEALKKLYKTHKNKKQLHDAFRKALQNWEYTPDLENIYLKLCPLRLAVFRIRSGKVKKLKDIMNRNEKKSFRDYFKENPDTDFSQTPDGKEIYKFAEEELKLDESVMKESALLKWLMPE